ncbi:MAG TPA: fumarylacetoacetate hydrolase family protein [Opitutaceae bacterium]|nr:fumarylacetoacetate hydrolase family protein [Opitutaceae bacterium]
MKLISFRIDGKATYGAIAGEGVVDLGARLGAKYPDLKSLLAGPGLAEAQAALKGARVEAKLEAVTLLPVIPNPGKIFCIGHNYEEHRLETERDPTAHPSVFLRLPESQVGHGQPILCPRESAQLDYEGEIAIVIGKPGRRIAEGEAWAHVAGYSCYNDGSVRDWQRHTGQFTPGKNFVATGAFGPWLVPAGEIPAGERLTLATRLNGKVMQEGATEMMIFPVPRLIAYCSTFLPLATGDVIVTGTPGGVGARRTPPVYMKPGDVVEVEVSRIGVLRNTIAVD